MQFPRHICNLHPTQTITNFCQEQTCMLPLCPSCIPVHLLNHPKCSSTSNGNPRIQNINNTFSRTLKTLSSYQQDLSERKQQIKLLQVEHNSLKHTLQEGLNSLKKEIVGLIDEWFEEVRGKFEQDVQEVLRKNDRSEFRLEMFEEQVQEKLRQVAESIQNFKNSHEFNIKTMVESMNEERSKTYTQSLIKIKQEIEHHRMLQEQVRFNRENTEMIKKIPRQFIKLLQGCIVINKQPVTPKNNQEQITYALDNSKVDRIKQNEVQNSKSTTNSSFYSHLEPLSKINQIQKSYHNLKLARADTIKQNYNNLPYQTKDKSTQDNQKQNRQTEGNKNQSPNIQPNSQNINHDLFYQQIVQNVPQLNRVKNVRPASQQGHFRHY